MRLFVAIPIDEDWRRAMQPGYQTLIRRYAEGVKWVPPEEWHLTVQFIGEVTGGVESQLIEAWNVVQLGVAPFQMQLSAWGCFPETGPERVVWAGVRVDVSTWDILRMAVAAFLATFDIAVDTRNSMPHITVGRVRDASQVWGLREFVRKLPIHSNLCEVSKITLIESLRSAQGARYRSCGSATLIQKEI